MPPSLSLKRCQGEDVPTAVPSELQEGEGQAGFLLGRSIHRLVAISTIFCMCGLCSEPQRVLCRAPNPGFSQLLSNPGRNLFMKYSLHPSDSFCCLHDLPGSFFPTLNCCGMVLQRTSVSPYRGRHIFTVKRSSCMSLKFVSALAQYLKYGCTAWELFWGQHVKPPAHSPVLGIQHQM